ncbi:MCE family protein [Runella rosea]|uniref:MCE family protein n=1 Tax=Runella rosea TaxID=2259595 RepID=A0A344THX6_9BACT|nr:MlaD family protein [Runella rosea]AXE18247.1 MCE family protein [Runella rosea]
MKSTSRSESYKVKVGIFVVLGIMILVAGILMVGTLRKTFVSKIDAYAILDDVNGLTKGSNVWFSGVKVGTVKHVAFVENSKVKVTFGIEESSQKFIKKDANVKVSTDGLIGNTIIVISGGSPEAEIVEDGYQFRVLKEDSQQDMLKTLQENNKNLLAITADFKELVRGIKGGEGSVGKLLTKDDLYQKLNSTLTGLEAATLNAKATTVSLAQFSKNLNTQGNFVNDLLTDKQMYGDLKQTVSTLGETSRNLKETSTSAKGMVADLRQTTNQIANDKTSTVGVLLHDPKTANNVRNTLQNLESSSAKLDENMEALQHNILLRRYFRKKKKEEVKPDTSTQVTTLEKMP